MIYRRKIKHGSQTGRKIGFPTLNFNVGTFEKNNKPGVYSCKVTIDEKSYGGALYFGKKMHQKNECLEVFVLDFSKQIYEKWITFEIIKYIREPMEFFDLNKLKSQIKKDLKTIDKRV